MIQDKSGRMYVVPGKGDPLRTLYLLFSVAPIDGHHAARDPALPQNDWTVLRPWSAASAPTGAIMYLPGEPVAEGMKVAFTP